MTTEQVFEMEGRLSAFDASFEAHLDDDEDKQHQAPAYYLEDNRMTQRVNLKKVTGKIIVLNV